MCYNRFYCAFSASHPGIMLTFSVFPFSASRLVVVVPCSCFCLFAKLLRLYRLVSKISK